MRPGVYTTAELRRRGFTAADVKRLVRGGRLRQIRRGWYATPDADLDTVTAVARGGALSCVSVLQRHDLWLVPMPPRLHVRPGKHFAAVRSDFCHGYGRPLPVITAEDDLGTALLVAARCMPDENWIVAADSLMNRRGLSVADLRALMGDVPGAVEDLLARCDSRSQSGTETLARVRLRARGFHVVVQPRIPNVGHTDLRIGRLIIECDSKEHHTDLVAYQTDSRRDRKATVGKWLTMRATYDDVLFGWEELEEDIYAVTRPRRHRIRLTGPDGLECRSGDGH